MVAVMMLVALLLLASSLLFWRRSQLQQRSERVLDRLQVEKPQSAVRLDLLQRVLLRAGIRITPGRLGLVSAVLVVVLAAILLLRGPLLALLALALLLVALWLYLQLRYQRRVSRMVEQLPSVLDHVVRSLKAGRSLADGLLLAFEQAQQPLRDALHPPIKNIRHGMPMVDALEEFALLYDRDVFYMLAMCVGVNQRYGGNAGEVFENLILLIRDRDLARRQLRALTGETRMSALVLGSLPAAMVVYMYVVNPEFLLRMWEQSSGQMLLLTAFGLQLAGSFVLWRMMRSI